MAPFGCLWASRCLLVCQCVRWHFRLHVCLFACLFGCLCVNALVRLSSCLSVCLILVTCVRVYMCVFRLVLAPRSLSVWVRLCGPGHLNLHLGGACEPVCLPLCLCGRLSCILLFPCPLALSGRVSPLLLSSCLVGSRFWGSLRGLVPGSRRRRFVSPWAPLCWTCMR